MLIDHVIKSNPAFKGKSFSRGALNALANYAWPGNVRELLNVVYRVLLLSKSNVIGSDDLPDDLMANPKVSGTRLEDVEREYILKILKEVGGQKGKAAEILGVDPKTLYRKLLSYGVNE